MKLLSTLLIILGILFCFFGSYHLWLKYAPNRLNFENYPTAQMDTSMVDKEVLPQRIIIKDVAIDTRLVPAKIANNIWETSDKAASYLVSSPLPGTEGNSIIYAHNWKSLFGNLVRVLPGQNIEVVFTDGSKKHFVVEYTSIVSPTQSDILAPSKDKRLTLYTCTGFLDSKRFVVVALLDEKLSIASADSE